MPGNSLSFPVRVGREKDFVRLFDFLPQRREDIPFPAYRDVFWFVIVLYIDSQRAFRQIAHMSLRRGNRIAASQELFDRLHFRRRLHDNQIMCHKSKSSINTGL